MRQRMRTLGVAGVGGQLSVGVLRDEAQGLVEDVTGMWQELNELCTRCEGNNQQQ
jgi:hypothetical protein